jgi:hypothetical protein
MDIDCRIDAYTWPAIADHLDAHGWAILEKLLNPSESAAVAGLYAEDRHFRSHIVMARYGFGRGEYKYFSYPLPDKIADLRTALYPRLAPIANGWNALMGTDVQYPDTHADFIARCHKAGQTRPTPLLLQYGEGDFNALRARREGRRLVRRHRFSGGPRSDGPEGGNRGAAPRGLAGHWPGIPLRERERSGAAARACGDAVICSLP